MNINKLILFLQDELKDVKFNNRVPEGWKQTAERVLY